MPVDLGSLLRTVAVTQMRVAHDVAVAVHRIENGETAAAMDPTSNPVREPITIEAAPAREWQPRLETITPVQQDGRHGYAGRGLAVDPGLDDATSIAQRYAPVTQMPR
jgi:hypothetical protein